MADPFVAEDSLSCSPPTISAVVVTFNSAGTIRPCLESLLSQTLKPKEIIVVDNASEDGTPDLVEKEFPDVKVIRNTQNRGFAQANIVGIGATASEFIALLNPDARADPKWLEEMHNTVSRDERIAMVGCKILHNDTGAIWSAGGKFSYIKPGMAFLIGSRERDDGQYNFTVEREFVDTCACLMRRSAIEKVGPFDKEYFLNVEDFDWGHRARKTGYLIIYEPKAVAWHKPGSSMGRGADYFFHNIKGHRYFIRKHFRGIKKLILTVNYKIYLKYLRRKFKNDAQILDAIGRAVKEAKSKSQN